jgi:signal transduction histidine kinase
MTIPDPETSVRKERDDTDASLLAERNQTDAELAHTAAVVDKDQDRIVEVASNRAKATLRAARDLADRDMTDAGAPAKLRREVQATRAAEDRTIADEGAVAAERLSIEREEHQSALANLLHLERQATDEGLMAERTRADEVVATRDDFLGMVSHDLRNMLGGIALSAALLAKNSTAVGDHGALTLRHAERIQRFTARMNRLVGDLLDVVSLEAGKLHVTLRPVDATHLVKDAAEAFQQAFVAQGINLTTTLSPGVIMVKCDHERILQVLANLLGNALKFTEHGGDVALSVWATDAGAHFSVIDTGVGIPAGHAAAIFERFRQVSTKDRRGLGLGLYIAKSIIDAHGGSIWAESAPSGGAAFHFTLPDAVAAPA